MECYHKNGPLTVECCAVLYAVQAISFRDVFCQLAGWLFGWLNSMFILVIYPLLPFRHFRTIRMLLVHRQSGCLWRHTHNSRKIPQTTGMLPSMWLSRSNGPRHAKVYIDNEILNIHQYIHYQLLLFQFIKGHVPSLKTHTTFH